MKVIEICDQTYHILEQIAEHWNERAKEWQKEDPNIKYIDNWDPETILIVLTMSEYESIKKEKK